MLTVPAAAEAASRYAVPSGGAGSGSCTATAPCTLPAAVASAVAGDTVLLAPGAYALGTGFVSGTSNITYAPRDAGTRPAIVSTNTGGTLVTLFAGDVIRGIDLNEMASNGTAISAQAANVTVQDVFITSGGTGVFFIGDGDQMLDSVVHTTGSGSPAIEMRASSTTGVTYANTLRNVTAVSDQSYGVLADSYGGTLNVSMVNSIALRQASAGADVDAFGNSGGVADLTMSYSDAQHGHATAGGGTVTDGGHNLAAAPALSSFRETAASPTIDAGTAVPGTGITDPDGNPRTIGPAPDIGAFEFQEPPSAVTGDASGPTDSGATLSGSVDGKGLATSAAFQIGTSPGSYTQTVTASGAGMTDGSVPVTATVTGLTPATTYYYRVSATNSAGTGVGTERSFTTTAAPSPTPTPTPTPTPGPVAAAKVSSLHQAHGRWRRTRARAGTPGRLRAPVGTAFAFTLDRAAKVRLSFAQLSTGRILGRRCHAAAVTARGRKCTLITPRGALTVSGRAGRDTVAFTGRVGRRRLTPGRYRISVTVAGSKARPLTLTFTIVG